MTWLTAKTRDSVRIGEQKLRQEKPKLGNGELASYCEGKDKFFEVFKILSLTISHGRIRMESGFLNATEATHYLGIKMSTLYSMVERKEIPHYRIGRLIKFTKADLDAFMQERRVDRIDIERKARRILTSACNPKIEVDALVKKNIAESRGNRYIASHGKPDRIKGLRKEASHGAL